MNLLPARFTYSLRFYLVCTMLFFLNFKVAGQSPLRAKQDTTPPKEVVFIDNADLLRVVGADTKRVTQQLVGNVELSQDSIYMYCDSADLVNEVQLYAYDNVIIQQGDSIAAFSDRLDYNAEDLIAHLEGNVILQNGTRQLYTDKLTYDLATKLATYTTGGRLTDGATELRSTRGYYYADRDEIFFRDSVVVIGEQFEMRADTLRYDAKNETVYFLGPTVIRTDTAEIYCEDGFYNVKTEEALFRKNAQYRSGEQIAAADSIVYAGLTQLYTLSGQAYVREGDKALARAERIIYNKRLETYELQGNALLVDSLRTVRGEYVRYDKTNNIYKVSGGRPEVIDGAMILRAKGLDFDEATGLGFATGNVEWRDTSANLTIFAERAVYNQETGYLKASGGRNNRPLLITILEGDSLFLTADTLFSQQVTTSEVSPLPSSVDTVTTVDHITSPLPGGEGPGKRFIDTSATTPAHITSPLPGGEEPGERPITSPLPAEETPAQKPTDTTRIIQAYRDVRIYKSDMQALCDSLAFNTTDSILTLFRDPMLWQDTSELTADTINVFIKNDALDKVHLMRKALVVTSPDSLFFNQVKGKDIYAYFDSSSLSRTDVVGNAEAIYYAQDEAGAYIGVNKTACSEMSLEFKNGGVHFIRFLDMPSGRLDPMKALNPSSQPTLEGRRADAKLRPRSLADLFVTRTPPSPPITDEEEEGGAATKAAKQRPEGTVVYPFTEKEE